MTHVPDQLAAAIAGRYRIERAARVERPEVLPILVITNFFDELQRKAGK